MVKKCANYLKHMLIHLISFIIYFLIFIFFFIFFKENCVVGIQIVNLISWTISMLFIFSHENNTTEGCVL